MFYTLFLIQKKDKLKWDVIQFCLHSLSLPIIFSSIYQFVHSEDNGKNASDASKTENALKIAAHISENVAFIPIKKSIG